MCNCVCYRCMCVCVCVCACMCVCVIQLPLREIRPLKGHFYGETTKVLSECDLIYSLCAGLKAKSCRTHFLFQ